MTLLAVKHHMEIIELHNYITEVAEGLPEANSKQLIELMDSLEELGPEGWSAKIAAFSRDMITQNIGDYDKLTRLEAEAENAGLIEIKPIFIILFVIVALSLVYYV